MIILGLTGSVAMGKSTVAAQFAEMGAATNNADAIVHALLAEDAEVIGAIMKRFPLALENGKINRKKLGDAVFEDDSALRELEAILHPKVREKEGEFVAKAKKEGKKMAVLDIPLLYETGAEARCDYVAVVTAPYELQRARALARPGMTEEKFQRILQKQMPDAEKRARADFVIETESGLDASMWQIKKIMGEIMKSGKMAKNGKARE